jgi:hypothetical protein
LRQELDCCSVLHPEKKFRAFWRHCEKRSDEAIHQQMPGLPVDCISEKPVFW